MELVPMSRHRRQRVQEQSIQEPLLDIFEDEYLISQYGRRNRRSQRMTADLMSPLAHIGYQPPAPMERLGKNEYHYRNQQMQPAHYQQYTHGSIVLRNNQNPAQDLACCAHGCWCFQCVRSQELGIIENFGAFQAILGPGLHVMCWPYSDISVFLSLRIQQLDIVCETRTSDNVFVHVHAVVQYRIIPSMAYFAHYKLEDPTRQIQSYVFDVVRAAVPRLTIEELFASKSAVGDDIQHRLGPAMKDFGYEIVKSLVTNLQPNSIVKAAMNEIEASRRMKIAMPLRSEAMKVEIIKNAEALAEASYLSGIGTARERMAIVQGLKEASKTWTKETNAPFHDVADMILVTQYLDTLAAIGANNMMLDPGPQALLETRERMRSQNMVPLKIPDLLQ